MLWQHNDFVAAFEAKNERFNSVRRITMLYARVCACLCMRVCECCWT